MINAIFGGYSILMNIFKKVNLATKVAFSVLKSTSSSNLTILNSSGEYEFNYKSKYMEAYNLCPPVQACVTKKANAITNGKLIPVDKEGIYKPNTHFDKTYKLLKRPNKYQNLEQFVKTIEVFTNVYGACYVYKVKPIGLSTESALIIIPNDTITINYKTNFNYIDNNDEHIVYYQVSIFNQTFIIYPEEISVIYDTTINLSKVIEPQSRIDAIWQNVENVINSVNSRNTMTKNRGAEGILTPERGGDGTATTIGLNEIERERLQKEYKKYGTTSSQWHTLISKIPMKFQSITRTPVALGLFDGENADSRTIAQQFGVPIPLLSLPDTTKFNTYKESKVEFYDDTIIPDARNIAMWLSEMFDTEKNGYYMKFDYSHLNFMQGDEKLKAETYNTMSSTVRENINAGLMTVDEGKKIISEYE